MRSCSHWRRVMLFTAAPGVLLINGCLAAAERSLDLILSPEAVGNALVAPYSAVSGLVQAFVTLVRG